jgi:hypothetical protein
MRELPDEFDLIREQLLVGYGYNPLVWLVLAVVRELDTSAYMPALAGPGLGVRGLIRT